ncbi:MAG: hypothetical protein JO225_06885 [Candidatus Eremiobacteraeota bacterium]|nr:hypothetical protein [Candidatus Eremiobacteraeota bacterium]
MMIPFVFAGYLALADPACPSDLLVANPQLKVVRARDKAFDLYVVTIDVKNRGTRPQPGATQQHLDLAKKGAVIGSQPIPPLGAGESYPAAFRVVLPHQKTRPPFTVEFRYVLDSKNATAANCTSANDKLTATL